MQYSLGEKINAAGDFLDSHLQTIKQVSLVVVSVFCAIQIKHSRMVHKYRGISSIPEHYFDGKKASSLPCIIREIDRTNGRIKVEHMPMFHRAFLKGNPKEWLEFELFGVKVNSERAISFVRDHLIHSLVRARLFRRNDKIILGDLRVKRDYLLNSHFDWLMRRCKTLLSLILIARSLAIPQTFEETVFSSQESKLMRKIIQMHSKVKSRMRIQQIWMFLRRIFARK